MNKLNAYFSKLLFVSLLLVSFSLSANSVDYAALYERVSDSVVTIKTQTIVVSAAGIGAQPGIGSGILIEPTLVLTAAHVVEGVDMISVGFKDGVEISGQVVATVEQSDAGLIRLATAHPDPVLASLGDSDSVKTGSNVFIIGAPYGIEQTLSVGIISGRMKRGNLVDGTDVEFLQTDTAINPGNSGGPMFNADGEVIGVVSFIMSKGGGFDGVGYASSINSAHQSIIKSSGFIAGFEGLSLSDQVRRALGLQQEAVLVQHVVEGSIADEFELKAGSIPAKIGNVSLKLGGDIILGVSCRLCKASMNNILSVAETLKNNSSTTISVLRDGNVIQLSRESSDLLDSAVAVMTSVHPGL